MAGEDKKIWQAYAKGVKRRPSTSSRKTFSSDCGASRKKVYPGPSQTIHTSALIERVTGSRINSHFPANAEKSEFSGMTFKFDRRIERSLRDGSLTVDAKLDLHGLTQAKAHAALEKFMATQVKAGHRSLLIITGKGSTGQSVLRNNLPQWLEALPTAVHILSLRPAAPKHGGSGAFYVILKRRRD